jgi:hypothetical protein
MTVEELLAYLKPQEADILKQRYGIEDGSAKSLQEIGNQYNITRERVRQIEYKALQKLRKQYYRYEFKPDPKIPIPDFKIQYQKPSVENLLNNDDCKHKIKFFRRCPGFSDTKIICVIWNVSNDSPDFIEAKKQFDQIIETLYS